MPSVLSSLLTGGGALLAVIGLIVAAGRVARRVQARRPHVGRRLALAEVLPLDTKRRVYLVACDGREALLLTGGTGDVLLGWLPGGAEP